MLQERREQEERERQESESVETVPDETVSDCVSAVKQSSKGRMQIFLTDEQEEQAVEFIRQHEEMYDRVNSMYHNRDRKDRLWDECSALIGVPKKEIQRWYDSQRSRYGRFKSGKSGQAAESLTTRQAWLKEKFAFLDSHIIARRKQGASSTFGKKATTSTAPPDDQSLESQVAVVDGSGESQAPMGRSSSTDMSLKSQFDKLQEMFESFLTSHRNSPRVSFMKYLMDEAVKMTEEQFTLYRNEEIKLLERVLKPPPVVPSICQQPQQQPQQQSNSLYVYDETQSTGSTAVYVPPQQLQQQQLQQQQLQQPQLQRRQ